MRGRNVLVIVLILAIVAGLGIAGFFVWKNAGQIQTYTNSAYHYSFSYPDKIFTATELDKNICSPHTIGCLNIDQKGDIVRLYDRINDQYYLTINMRASDHSYYANINDMNVPNEVKPLTIDGDKAYLLIFDGPTGNGKEKENNKLIVVSDYSIKGSKIYSSFQWLHKGKSIEISSEEIPVKLSEYVPKILSTFKFTDQNLGTVKYTCPQNGWVDCMPILTPEKKIACSQEAFVWYKANCPNFQGGAQ